MQERLSLCSKVLCLSIKQGNRSNCRTFNYARSKSYQVRIIMDHSWSEDIIEAGGYQHRRSLSVCFAMDRESVVPERPVVRTQLALLFER